MNRLTSKHSACAAHALRSASMTTRNVGDASPAGVIQVIAGERGIPAFKNGDLPAGVDVYLDQRTRQRHLRVAAVAAVTSNRESIKIRMYSLV